MAAFFLSSSHEKELSMKQHVITLALATILALPATAEEQQGTLVIAGGALSSATMDVYEAFVNSVDSDQVRIGVVPAATGSINKKFLKLQEIFSQFGVSKNHIVLLPLAVKDDKKTKDTDESTWLTNGNDTQLADDVKKLNAIWFVGGDQTLITQVLLNKDGSDTKVLGSIREVFHNGGVIGGTSAGAAIMSKTMLAGGNSTGALFQGSKQDYTSMDEQEYGPVVTRRGANFFTYGTIDQHFDRKARLGRLIVSLLEKADSQPGYGIDEGTAMVVKNDIATVVGRGGVTVINVSSATHTKKQYPLRASNVRLSYLQPGDEYNLSSHTYIPRPKSYKTVGHEYFDVPDASVSGIMSSNRNLDEFIGFNILDNKSATQAVSWVLDGENQGIKLTFSQDEQSEGYWSQDITADVYSFENVKLNIDPISVQFND